MGEQPVPACSLTERIVAGLPHGVLAVDARGRVVLANPAARRLLGLAGEADGRDAAELLAGVPALREVLGAALTGGPAAAASELTVGTDERRRVLALQVAPLPAAGSEGEGAGRGVVLTLTDVGAGAAERREAILAGIGRLTHHVAHELKNPLGALKLYALLLGRRAREPKPESGDLPEKITRAVEHLSAVVGQVTSLGLPAVSDRAPVPLGAVLDDCLAAVPERTDPTRLAVVRHEEPGLTVAGDRRALRQALGALVDNALEAMGAEGTLTVATRRTADGMAEVSIRDTGPGVAPEAQARLFEPFFTTKKDRTGLGMALARSVVEQHGGRIGVSSEPNAGTTIRVVLPAA